MSTNNLAQSIYQKAIECGYENCGIIPISDLDGYKDSLNERIAKVPQSAQLYKNAEAFTHIKEQYPWAKSAVVCITWYGKYRYPESLQGKYAKSYFLSPESVPNCTAHQEELQFQEWMTGQGLRWEGGEKCGATRNLPLRHAAVAARLGIFRKNNFFYTEKGSYYGLEGYLIDEECTYKQTCSIKACAQNCTLCQGACKTHALSAPYTMNPIKCVSFWTTFGQGSIPPYLKESQFENWICGCDACQDACPYNRHDWNNGEDFPGLDEITELLQPKNILNASDDVLCEKVIPKTVAHIKPEQVNTLRTTAARMLRNSVTESV